MVHQGRLINVSLERVTLPNQRKIDLELVRHPGGAVIVALNDNNEICLLRQYRYAVEQQTIWELPAGCIDAGDDSPLATAKRELREEAGLIAKDWKELGHVYPSPGFCTEKLFLYLARQLQQKNTEHQSDELIQVHWIDFNEALRMARSGDIQDAKTLAGLFLAQPIII